MAKDTEEKKKREKHLNVPAEKKRKKGIKPFSRRASREKHTPPSANITKGEGHKRVSKIEFRG